MDPFPTTTAERFEAFVVPEVDVLLRVAKSLTRHTQDAEDLVQDTLLRAYRSMDTFDGSHPRSWLLTIMRNAEINRHRRQRPRLLTEAEMDGPDAVGDDGATAETKALASTFDAAVVEALNALPDTFREAVELIDLRGLTYAEAAAATGVAEGTLMSRAHRGRRRMRTRLQQTGFEPGGWT
jgi:RNA polymerase sigma-70 factor (ECF subfamily)